MANTLEAGASQTGAYVRGIRWGLVVLVVAAAMIWYGAYGDPHPKADQQAAVPFLIGVMAIVTAALFAGLVPPGLRAMATKPGGWSAVGLGLSVLGLLAVPVASWAGLPVVLGVAGAVLGAAGAAAKAKAGSWARAIGVVAVALSVVMLVLGNTVMSQ